MDKIENSSYIYFNEDQIKKSSEKKKNNKITSDFFEPKTKFNTLILESEMDSIQKKPKANIEEEIASLQKELGIQGEVLKKSKSINDLDLYKKIVKKYLSVVISLTEKVEKKELLNWHKYKKEKEKKTYLSVTDIKKDAKLHLSIIDKELYELTREFIKSQRNIFLIAAKIDRIEGILVNLLS